MLKHVPCIRSGPKPLSLPNILFLFASLVPHDRKTFILDTECHGENSHTFSFADEMLASDFGDP